MSIHDHVIEVPDVGLLLTKLNWLMEKLLPDISPSKYHRVLSAAQMFTGEWVLYLHEFEGKRFKCSGKAPTFMGTLSELIQQLEVITHFPRYAGLMTLIWSGDTEVIHSNPLTYDEKLELVLAWSDKEPRWT